MNKELECPKCLNVKYYLHYGIPHCYFCNAKMEYVEQATPTADEICKALRCDYDKEHNMFYNEGEWGILLRDGKLDLDDLMLAPHLITMIGRFYEENNNG